MGVLFKFLLIVFALVYLLRAAAPFLFKLLFSNLVRQREKKEAKQPTSKKKDNATEGLGEYIDYEEIE